MIALVENRIYPFSPEEREAGHFCYHGVNSPLCPGKTQDTVVQPPRWESQLKVCATHLWPPNKYLGRMTSQCQISPQAHYPTPQESQKSKVRHLVGTWMGVSFLSVRIIPWPDPWISMWCSFRNLTCFLFASLFSGLQSMPGEYVSQGGPMGMSMAQPSYTPPQMTPHPTQLRHGPPMHSYLPSHPHHPAMMMHGGPPTHPGMTMSAQSPTMLNSVDPNVGGQVMDIHAQ